MKALLIIIPATIVVFLYLPTLQLELMGDDYQWLQLAHEATLHPRMLFADLDTFFRPTNTWTMVLEKLIWSENPAGYHLTNLLLHATVAVLLIFAGNRLGLSRAGASLVGLFWGCSQFSSEPAIRVASRHEDLLFIGWLGMILIWPKKDQTWSFPRIFGAIVFIIIACCSKETWIVTPAIAFALDIFLRQLKLPRALRNFAGWLALSALYSLIHFLIFPTTRGYFRASFALFAKIPHQLASFLYFEGLVPKNFPLTWKGALALVLVIGFSFFVLKRKRASGALGIAFLAFPMALTLFIPFLPTRYTAIPYGGFLLLSVTAFESFAVSLTSRARSLTILVITLLAGAMFLAGVFSVKAELEDAALLSDAHKKLLDEARQALPEFPLDRPVLVVRGEHENLLQDIASRVRGLPKPYYVRRSGPYGLIDCAALFDWVLQKRNTIVRRYDSGEIRFQKSKGAVLMHRSGGFAWVSQSVPDIGAESQQWNKKGFFASVIAAEVISSEH